MNNDDLEVGVEIFVVYECWCSGEWEAEAGGFHMPSTMVTRRTHVGT